TTCLDRLKGNSFEIYQVDTQSYLLNGNVALGHGGTMQIDSQSTVYSYLTFNAKGDSVTKYPLGNPRKFSLVGTLFHFGDDVSEMISCEEKKFVLTYNDNYDAFKYTRFLLY